MPKIARPVIAGERHGKLISIKEIAPKVLTSGKKQRMCLCECDCGNMKDIPVSRFFDGGTVSCGCHRKANKRTHGLSKTRVWDCYHNMIARCTRQSNTYYENYGGRGITVCDRWLGSFENFLEDMGVPDESLTIDRIDVDKGYSKENCRWVSMGVQGYNRRLLDSNSTGRSGVTFKDGKYRARISFNGERIELYYGNSYDAAVRAREIAEIKYYGELKPEARGIEIEE